MSPSLGPDPEGRVLDLIDQRVRELMRGDLVTTDLQPRAMRADRIRPSGNSNGALLVDDGRSAVWVPNGKAGMRKRWSAAGVSDFAASTGDMMLAYGTASRTQFVALGGPYTTTGMIFLNALDLLAGGTNWRVRPWYDFVAGDPSSVYGYLIGGNVSGVYSGTAFTSVGTTGLYPQNTDSGAIQYPITVGGGGAHYLQSFVGAWSDRATLVASGRQVFGPGFNRATAPVSVGWFGQTGLEVELLAA